MTAGYDLYGAEASSFTCKVKSYFRYKKIPFAEFPNTPNVYREVIVPRVGFRIIPVVIGPDDETLQDSTDIIDALEVRFPQSSIYPQTARQHLIALLMEHYGDEWLKMAAMHYRWNKDRDWAIREFGRMLAPELDEEARLSVGQKSADYFVGGLPALGVTPKTEEAIENSCMALLGELDRHFSVYEFLFGTRPSIGDFGLVGPLYANFYRDPRAGEMTRKAAPSLFLWINRMMRQPRPNGGEFLSRDEVPETLLPVFARMMKEMLPVLVSTAEHFTKWVAVHPEISEDRQEIPARIGSHVFALGDSKENRDIFPYDLWMLQRAQDCLQAMSDEDRNKTADILRRTGGDALLDFPVFPRLVRRNFKLALA